MRRLAFSSNAKTNSVGGLNPPNLLRIYTCVIKTTWRKKTCYWLHMSTVRSNPSCRQWVSMCVLDAEHIQELEFIWSEDQVSSISACVDLFIYLFIHLQLTPCGPSWLNGGFFQKLFRSAAVLVWKYRTYQKFWNALCKTRVLHVLALWRNETCSTLFASSCSCWVFSRLLTGKSRFEQFKTLGLSSSLKQGIALAHPLSSFVAQTEQGRQQWEGFIMHKQKASQN